jgi:hypothetical protein
MAKRRRSSATKRKGPSPYARRLAAVAKSLGQSKGSKKSASLASARQVLRKRRGLFGTKLYDTYARGFAINEAIRTGKLPSLKAVKANPAFQRAVNVILSTNARSSKNANGPLARALTAVGVRDERAKYQVGNSPDAGVRSRRVRRPTRKLRGGGGMR